MARLAWLDDLAHDCRYAVRTLRRAPAFSAAATLTLALGIGATTAIFSVVNGVVLRPLPFRDPGRLVQMYGTPAIRGEAVDNLESYRAQSRSFDALVGYSVSARFMKGPAGPERVITVAADPGFFEMLGVPARAGRMFTAGDGDNVAVVSEAFARDHLGGDAAAVGMTVPFDGTPFTIVGVMPESFEFPYASSALTSATPETRTDAWTPLVRPAATATRTERVTGRLKPGVTIDEAASELDVISARIQESHRDPNGARGVRLAPLGEAITASVRSPLLVLLGAVGIVLLLAGANVINLSLVRLNARAHELSVRSALGAGRGRLVRQLVAESFTLAFAGGSLGLLAAYWGTGELAGFAAAALPRAREVSTDWRVLLFTCAVSLTAALTIGIVPALLAERADAQDALREAGARTTMSRRARGLRNALVVAEIALAFAVAAGAALMIRELVRLRHIDTGMDTAGVVTFHLGERPAWWGVSRQGPPLAEDVRAFYEIAREAARLPGVEAAGFTQFLPLQNWGWGANMSDFRVRGERVGAPFQAELRYVTPGYFDALGIPVTRGRGFTDADNRAAAPVIVVNETLAARVLGEGNPIGAVTSRGTIVGVVRDVRQASLDRAASPEIYYPMAQNYSQVVDVGMTLVVRGAGDPASLIAPVRDVIRRVSPGQAVFNVKTMTDVVNDSLADFRLYLWLMIGFALLALALAAIGTYGVMAYATTSRTREFAVRVALGADRATLTSLVLRDSAKLVGAGIVLGSAATLAEARLLRALPVTIHPPGVPLMAGVAAVVAGTALIASLLPAMRAGGADPIDALRQD